MESDEKTLNKKSEDLNSIEVKNFSDSELKILIFRMIDKNYSSNDIIKIFSKIENHKIKKETLIFCILSNKFSIFNILVKLTNIVINEDIDLISVFSINNNFSFFYKSNIKPSMLIAKSEMTNSNALKTAIANKTYKSISAIINALKIDYRKDLIGSFLESVKTYNMSEILHIIKIYEENNISLQEIIDKKYEEILKVSLLYKNHPAFMFFISKSGFFDFEKIDVDIIKHIFEDFKLIKILLNKGFSANYQTPYGDSPVIFLLRQKNIQVEDKIKILEILIDKNFNVNIRNSNNDNILHFCHIFNEDVKIIDFLKAKNIIDNRNNDGYCAEDLKNDFKIKEDYIMKYFSLYEEKIDDIF